MNENEAEETAKWLWIVIGCAAIAVLIALLWCGFN
jgi:bacteriorhodopsin